MKGRSLILLSVVAVLIAGLAVSAAFAADHKKKDGHRKGMDEKLFYKAHMMLRNEIELGLSDEQVGMIKDLKLSTKKSMIRQKAEIEILALDVKAAMWKDTIDVEAVGKLIDQKYELKKQKAKSLVAAYAELKGILTKEQKDKLKELWKSCKASKGKE